MALTGKPVARVNGSVLTDRDLLREMYMIFPYARQHNGTFPQAMEADIRRGALKMIEFEELVYQEALRRKMTIAPARLNLAEKEFSHQFHTPDQYRTFLATECRGDRRVLRAKIRRSLLIEDLLKADVDNKSAVSMPEVSAYYRQHPEKFRMTESFAIQTISMLPAKTGADPSKEARKRADDALRQAKATKSYEEFGMLAERISEDDYRVVMGDHKLVERSKLPPQILSVVEKMQPGQVSDVIQVDQVYTIARLNAHVPAGMRQFADVKDRLREYLRRENVERLRSGLNARLRKTAKIEEL
jgi:parvulin-like peptidyl-prolyl isomerase